MAVDLPSPGEVLSGTYRIERLIAKGGMGAVFEAAHVRSGERFAIKVLLRPVGDADPGQTLERFKREAEAATALKSEHVVKTYDHQISAGGLPYIVLELLVGQDLQQRLQRVGRLEPAVVLRIVTQTARVLDAAHALGIVHRDLKPANIFLSERPKPDFVKVLDFGISKMIEWSTITHTDALLGTPLYMSPEQASGSDGVTHVSDVFSLGAIAYEMLTGTRPFGGASIPSILYQVVHTDAIPVSHLLGRNASELDAVFTKVLAKDRRERFGSAGKFARALSEALRPLLPVGTTQDETYEHELEEGDEMAAQATRVHKDSSLPELEPHETVVVLARSSALTAVGEQPGTIEAALPRTQPPPRRGVALPILFACALVGAAAAGTVFGLRARNAGATRAAPTPPAPVQPKPVTPAPPPVQAEVPNAPVPHDDPPPPPEPHEPPEPSLAPPKPSKAAHPAHAHGKSNPTKFQPPITDL